MLNFTGKHFPIYCLFCVYAICFSSCGNKDTSYQPSSPVLTNASLNKFVGAQRCQSCHSEQFKSWSGSHHDQAMKIANEQTILGDFNNANYSSNGVKYRFFKKENQFFVNTQDGDGQYKDFEIVHTFGVTPLQQYLVKFPNGSYQCLQAAWDSEKGKWFDLQPDLQIATEEWLHWTRGAMTWNTMCADCHSTDLRKNYIPATETYETTFSEINVACESCHGPASQHVAHYENPTEANLPDLKMTSNNTSTEVVDNCARCHSRRGQITSHYDYEGTFLDHYDPALISDANYELDGQIREEDYVWASFTQSKMYHNNVSCRDCHNVHSLKLKQEGNQLCMQCHEPKYDSPAHHYHKANTEASQCINCHMTGKTYMGNDFRRDHSFRVPRPDQTVQYGTPNACNSCHEDKSAKWASNFIESKYGNTRPKHFSDLLLKGYHGDRKSLEKLMADPSFPAIARATAIHYYTGGLSPAELANMKKFLKDSSALVRNQTARLFSQLDGGSAVPEITSLLSDEVRVVRITAAKYLDRTDPNAQASDLFAKAMKENMEAMKMQADFPGGQHAYALYYESKGNKLAAIAAYRKALEIDNYYNQARMNLALLLYQQGQAEEAMTLYEKVIAQEPDYSQSYYMLGLLNNEIGNKEAAIKYLSQACKKQPANDRAFYNYALLLQQDNKFDESIAVIQEANLNFPNHEELIYIQLLAEMKTGKVKQAQVTIKRLISLSPSNPNYQQIKQQIEGQ